MCGNRRTSGFLIVILGLMLAITNSAVGLEEKAEKLFAYVACEDRRIYVVDLVENNIVLRSDEIREAGLPTAIDIDQKRGRLYMASERGRWQEKYSPIIVLDVSTTPMQVVNQFNLVEEQRTGSFVRVSAVYEIYVSPDGEKLLLGYSHPKYNRKTTVVDSTTGQILYQLDFKIHLDEIVFSSDHTKIAKIWEKGRAVYDLIENKRLSLKKGQEVFSDGIGLNPPWAKISSPLYTIENYKYLKGIDRNNGKSVLNIDLEAITGGLNTSIKHPLLYDKGSKTIIPMVGVDRQGYVIIIDLEKKQIISKIEVGKNPTNLVLNK